MLGKRKLIINLYVLIKQTNFEFDKMCKIDFTLFYWDCVKMDHLTLYLGEKAFVLEKSEH